MKFLSTYGRTEIAAIALTILSLFGFMGNVMLDYNWGTNFITNSFAIVYSLTIRQLIPFPVGHFGVGAAVYLGLFLISFLILNKRMPLRENVLQTLSLASAVIVLFEMGLYYFVPYFMNLWVIQGFYGTPLRYFTNVDLLATAISVLIVSQACLARLSSMLLLRWNSSPSVNSITQRLELWASISAGHAAKRVRVLENNRTKGIQEFP